MGRVPGWDAERRCLPVCWTRRDGGWAAEVWELWQVGIGMQDGMSGAWVINWPAFAVLVPPAMLADDETRLELADAFQVIAREMNNPKEALFPDPPED